MPLRHGLLRIYWRQALPATGWGLLSLTLYALICPGVMSWRDLLPMQFIGLQCLLLAILLGRFNTPAFAFLYSRGYSRNQLWGHLMLVSVLSVFIAWLPAALTVWSGLRSSLHDWFQSPYFPVMAPREALVPWIWLGIYLVFLPAFHYAWIRLAQPTRGQNGGILAAGAMIAALLAVYSMNGWFAWPCVGTFSLMVPVFLLGARMLHRNLEVRA
ncbi:MAG: hypothetical protein JXB10_08555 [Pirellulales bacterium]|nr:hypothetical protein [Pirellulales bacterium]